MTSLKDSNNADDQRRDADSHAASTDGESTPNNGKPGQPQNQKNHDGHQKPSDGNRSNQEHPSDNTDGASSDPSAESTGDETDDEALWKQFEAEHADDLDDISSSRNAKRFEKRAKREEKKALLSVEDITADSFADGFSSSSSKQHGPRDFEGSSWLDTDDVMDRLDDFTPPNPDLGHLDPVKVVFWALLIAGIAGLIAAVFFPRFASILGLVFGLCALIGGVGLLSLHKGHSQTRTDYFDDGSRV